MRGWDLEEAIAPNFGVISAIKRFVSGPMRWVGSGLVGGRELLKFQCYLLFPFFSALYSFWKILMTAPFFPQTLSAYLFSKGKGFFLQNNIIFPLSPSLWVAQVTMGENFPSPAAVKARTFNWRNKQYHLTNVFKAAQVNVSPVLCSLWTSEDSPALLWRWIGGISWALAGRSGGCGRAWGRKEPGGKRTQL